MYKNEICYLIDGIYLLHMEQAENSWQYEAFEKIRHTQIGKKELSVRNRKEALTMALDDLGLTDRKIAVVSVNMLKTFAHSSVYRRLPETLPQNDIRVIDGNYNELFRIPDGGCLQIAYPDRTFVMPCRYIDPTHAYYAGECLHICQFAEIIERNHGKVEPEPELNKDKMMWKIGHNYLSVQVAKDGWDYSLSNENFNSVENGHIADPNLSINEARNQILVQHQLDRCSIYRENFENIQKKIRK